ncbi:nuclear receptor coactivator 6-like isoform X2 [Oryza brachyantha]|uniref:SFR19-like C-terminal domain-containing protein n=1 Tax=Oryza brachyantha TaxID=4533 RepID=J3LLE2_ORYBR|nr:nuclear receptor coactivator 6-like isoform X2 [Oryza brachyantha]
MYGQGGNFNPQYRHAAPPPLPQQQAGVTSGLPQQPLPPPPPRMAQYPQPPAMAAPPPGPYQHGMPLVQNQHYPFAQMHQMPMLPQQRGYAQMPMPGPPSHPPPPQAMYQAHPQYPMAGSLPPPPPRPPSFAQENVLPPSSPPPPPPPPPPSSPPPAPPSESTAPKTGQASNSEPERKEGATYGGHDLKTEKAANQLIVSDDSDMDMDADEDSPSREHHSPINSSLATAECTGNDNAPKSVSDVSSLGNGSVGKAKTTAVTVEGRSTFQLVQAYTSDDSGDEDGVGAARNLVAENNESGHSIDTSSNIGHRLLTEAAPCSEKILEAQEHQLMNKCNPVKHDSDELGHLVKEDMSGNDSDRGQQTRRHGRSQWKRSRVQSPQGQRSCSPPSKSLLPGRQSSSPLGKRANRVGHTFREEPGIKLGKDGFYNDKHDCPAKAATAFEIHRSGEGNISGDRISEQEDPVRIKLNNSSDHLYGSERVNDASVGSLGQHGHGVALISGPSESMASSANASDPHKMQRSGHASIPQPDMDKSSLAAHQSLAGQSPGIPFATVHATEKSMTCDVPQSHSQNLCPPAQATSGLRPSHIPSSNMTPLPGQQLLSSSEFPQMHFQPNVMVPANEFLQSQMQTYPAPDLSHPRPLDFHPHTLQPVVPSHLQPAAMVHSSFQRLPPNLPGSSDFAAISDTDLPKSSIKPHYNPFASTFEQTDPSLNIGCDVIPNAVGSASTKAADHMGALSPFGLSVPGSGTHARENSAEVVSSRRKQPRREFTSSAPYDPLLDSIEPSSSSINKMDLGREANLSATDRNASKIVNIEVESKNMHGLGLVAESEVEEFGEVAADTEAGVVENLSPEPLGAKDWSSDIPGDIDNDESVDKTKRTKDSRSMKLFKAAIADFVKEVLKPSWRQGNISREAFKTIVKKTVDKVSSAVPNNHIPKTPAKIKQYVQSSQKKVTKLVMGYVDKYVKL